MQESRRGLFPGARVTVSYTGDPQNVIEELITDGDGRTETLDLATPPLEYSLEPNVNQPYSEYTVKVEAEGYEPVEVTGSELLSGEQSVQQVDLEPAEGAAFADVTIPDHTLFGEYPGRKFRKVRSSRRGRAVRLCCPAS